ncbi:hypothetical protein [Micromonospora sp. NPDC049645]|uniref:hypothetical protein n=1 Tax=Micromonospora sp. NPDC049645 TaxID=3155508 RepID=UPI0034277CFA
MTAPIADSLTYPTASALRDCLREQLALTLHGPIARAAVRWGAVGSGLDGCDCEERDDAGGIIGRGAAWVRVAGVAPAPLDGRARSVGPIRATVCRPPWLVTYELGVSRCYPLTDSGAPLSAVDQDIAAQRMLSDQAAVLRAVSCCAYLDKHSGVELVRVDPTGPAGGCAGVTATIRVLQPRG